MRCGREDCFCSEHPEFPIQDGGESRGTESQEKEDRLLRGKQVAFMICDCFRVTGAHGTVPNYAALFFVTFHDDNVHEFDMENTNIEIN